MNFARDQSAFLLDGHLQVLREIRQSPLRNGEFRVRAILGQARFLHFDGAANDVGQLADVVLLQVVAHAQLDRSDRRRLTDCPRQQYERREVRLLL